MTSTLDLVSAAFGCHDDASRRDMAALLARAGMLTPSDQKTVQVAPQQTSQPLLVLLDPANIEIDAPTYQFRSHGDRAGVTAKRRFTSDSWNPILHSDPIIVHERLDGRIFVADGHHRLDLAKRLNSEGRGPGRIAALVLREADGYSAKDVRIIAAYKNMQRGNADMIDTARVFKDSRLGDVHTELLPSLQMDMGNLRISYSLSKLSDASLEQVQKGKVPAPMAAYVADRVSDPVRQASVLKIIHRKLRQEYDWQPAAYKQEIVHYSKEMPASALVAGYAEKIRSQRTSSHLRR